MKLSDAIKFGSRLRGESPHSAAGDRFVMMANTEQLHSDAWGAACEAAQPAVGKFNWTTKDKYKFESAMDALRAVQQLCFGEYWKMPARCPGAKRQYSTVGLTVADKSGNCTTQHQQAQNIAPITSECDKVTHLAGMVDHLFYAHGWTRQQVAEAVRWYEETRTDALLVSNFEHVQSESLRRAISQRVNIAAREREQQRRNRRRIYAVN
jgi:hypothetical protein